MQYALALLAAAAAVKASPFAFPVPGGVTEAISPTASAPSGCVASTSGSFGIVVLNPTQAASLSSAAAAEVTQTSDGQPEAATATTVPVVSEISDGQPQATTKVISIGAASQISDGQPQIPTATMYAISQIGDGQIQAATTAIAISQIGDGQIQAPKATPTPTTVCAVSEIADGQPQQPCSSEPATTVAAVSEISDGQPQATPETTVAAVSQISDGQPQATPTSTVTGVSQISDAQPQAPSASATAAAIQMVTCASNDTLSLTLENGVLKDSKGRTGYIASNYQFQFDDPPQAGAIYTSGFTVCGNGSLALGGSAVWWQCLSGDFYNLYDRYWAAQCSPVALETVELVTCS